MNKIDNPMGPEKGDGWGVNGDLRAFPVRNAIKSILAAHSEDGKFQCTS